MTKAQDEIIGQWMQVGRFVRKRMVGFTKEKGINPSQLFALLIIHDHNGLTMKEFADFLKITSPSATALANRLVKLGWLARKTDPKNRKLVRLTLSPRGVRTLMADMKVHQTEMKRMLSLLSLKDQADFGRILHNLRTALERDEIV